ncbi:hypothetical protein ABZ379_07855 [Streptomyces canus]|uniref:hypothetical protein n=1 Tax=Streptomyces canus TaxID=58343 RepID=UPI0033CBA6F9
MTAWSTSLSPESSWTLLILSTFLLIVAMESSVFEGSFAASQPASWMALTLSAMASAVQGAVDALRVAAGGEDGGEGDRGQRWRG